MRETSFVIKAPEDEAEDRETTHRADEALAQMRVESRIPQEWGGPRSVLGEPTEENKIDVLRGTEILLAQESGAQISNF
jgi:hypothetical protein